MTNLVTCSHLTCVFDMSAPRYLRLLTGAPERKVLAVNDVSFSIKPGETYALVGESGSGKSTIAQMMVGLQPVTSGKVVIDGIDITSNALSREEAYKARRTSQMVFQSPYASLNPRWRVKSIIAEALQAAHLTDNHDERVADLLLSVGLSPQDARKYPHEFSGGQRQRISIARALATSPRFLICDEPTSALDVSVQAQVLNLLKKLQEEQGLAMLFITHDLAVVRTMADRVGVLKHGMLVEENDANIVINEPVDEYTKSLIAAVPRMPSH